MTSAHGRKRRLKDTGTPRNQANVQLTRGDIVEFEIDGEVMKATVIYGEKASDWFHNNFNVECDDGGSGNIKFGGSDN